MEKRGRTKAPETARPDDQLETVNGIAAEMADAPTADGASPADETVPEHAELYGRLATPFDVTFRDLRGGVELEYVRRITRR